MDLYPELNWDITRFDIQKQTARKQIVTVKDLKRVERQLGIIDVYIYIYHLFYFILLQLILIIVLI